MILLISIMAITAAVGAAFRAFLQRTLGLSVWGINILSVVAMGILLALIQLDFISNHVITGVTGFFGGFSTVSGQVHEMYQQYSKFSKAWLSLLVKLLASVFIAIAVCAVTVWLMQNNGAL